MSLFDDLEESLKKTYNTSLKQSFNDMGLDEEERDKIVHSISGTGLSVLDVDYSNFSNHVFFGSAYAAANFALARIIRDYPTDGELKEKNVWHDTNTGYENWFFDNFPKQQGYIVFNTGSNACTSFVDHERKLLFSTGSLLSSFTLEAVVNPIVKASAEHPIINIVDSTLLENISLSIKGASGGDPDRVSFIINTFNGFVETTASVSSFLSLSSSFHVAGTYNKDVGLLRVYINGAEQGRNNIGSVTGSFDPYYVDVGYRHELMAANHHWFSGGIDDVRIWSSARSSELLKRNYFRTIHSNHSGGLKLYYKFNQPSEYGDRVLDYSGNDMHSTISGGTYSTLFRSGTLGSWFKDAGDPILALNNTRTNDFLTEQRNSGSLYDDSNDNMIFNLVPSVFIEGDDTEYQQLFLLLTARHFDRLKLYIQHLTNITKAKTSKFDGPPDNLLDLAAKHYGLDIGNIYSSADPLQNYFGENVYSSGALESSIETIRTALKRNILANMSYLLKSKGTQEAIRSTLHSIGLNDSIVSISEYTDFSGGVQTTFSPKTVERRVAHFLTSSNVFITSSAHSVSETRTHQFRALFNTGSQYLTQSLFCIDDTSSGRSLANIIVERNSLTASHGVAKFVVSGTQVFSSSILPLFDNKWINFNFHTAYITPSEFYVSSMDRGGLIFEESSSFSPSWYFPANTRVYLGSSGSNKFDGFMSEYRCWSGFKPSYSTLNRWSHDWELTEIQDPINDYDKLIVHHKLDDFTGSVTGGGPIHNYVNGLSGSSYLGFSSSAQSNFPGKYIDKFDVSHTYDLNVDNDKIRIKNQTDFTDNDQNYDIPFVSIDFSPITSLNKEIMKWMGNLERITQIVSDPLYQYRDINSQLDAIRSAFFRERVQSRIDYAAFADLIKWFDNNFSFLLSQFIPLDMGSSISNYVIEPHILEYSKVKKFAGAGSAGKTSNLESTISRVPSLVADGAGNNLGLADPGRFGSFVSASAEVSLDAYLVYKSSSNGMNYDRRAERKVIDNVLRDDIENNAPRGYGNGFYTTIITGSNYLKNTLNVNPHFAVSGIHWAGGPAKDTQFFSSSHGEPTSPWTGSFNGYQDARWLWSSGSDRKLVDFGIGYGGMFGQLISRNNKSINGLPFGHKGFAGGTSVGSVSTFNNTQYVKTFNGDNLRTAIFWPNIDTYDGVELFLVGAANVLFSNGDQGGGFGPAIDIEDYNTLNIEIIGRTNPIVAPSDYILSFYLQFQFYSSEVPGTIGFETVMSSSRGASGYTNSSIEVAYTLQTTTLQQKQPLNFTLTMERSLPKQKYMRVQVTPSSQGGAAEGSFFVLCKAVLSNNERTTDDISIREA